LQFHPKEKEEKISQFHIMTCIDNAPAMTVGGKREEAPEGDAITTLGARPVHPCRDIVDNDMK
jgi:hypothetical protein